MDRMIVESMYFPPVSVLSLMGHHQEVWIDEAEHYRKGSFRNKCMINSSGGPQNLIIPLAKGKNNRQPMSEVLISYDEDWPRQHLAAIRTSYGKSPYFIYFFDEIEILLHTRYRKLADLNRQCLELLLKYLVPGKKTEVTDLYKKEFEGLDVRHKILPKNYSGIPVPRYPQVFEDSVGFVPNLSALDLLFCLGKYGGEVLIKNPLP